MTSVLDFLVGCIVAGAGIGLVASLTRVDRGRG